MFAGYDCPFMNIHHLSYPMLTGALINTMRKHLTLNQWNPRPNLHVFKLTHTSWHTYVLFLKQYVCCYIDLFRPNEILNTKVHKNCMHNVFTRRKKAVTLFIFDQCCHQAMVSPMKKTRWTLVVILIFSELCSINCDHADGNYNNIYIILIIIILNKYYYLYVLIGFWGEWLLLR